MSFVAPEAAAPVDEHGTAARAPSAAVREREPEPLGVVPRPGPESSVVPLDAVAGGLTARQAQWGVDGGEVLLTGDAPFLDLTGRAGFRSDGTLDGTVTMRAAVRLLGLHVAQAEWTVAGWTADVPLVAPAVQLQGTTLVVDLAPVGADVALTAAEGLATERTETGATITLPEGTVTPGVPLEPRVVELFRGLRGWDVSALRAHPEAPVETAPAFVSNTDLFFAPGRYGPDSAETAALLDAAIRAALAGIVGPVAATPPAPPPEPAPDAGTPPITDTTQVSATVPPVPAVQPIAEEAAGVGAAGPVPEGGSPAEAGAPAVGALAEAEAAAAGEAGAPPPAAVEVELIMPPAPTEPGPAATARAGAVGGGAGGAARAARDLPPAADNVTAARGAVTEPVAETAARAREDLAAALGGRPAPSPEIVELCDRIRTAIREHRPVDEDALLRTDPTHEAQSAGATVSGSVEGQVGEVQAGYADLNNPPGGTPALTPTPVVNPSPTSPGMGVDATSAAPDPIPAENLSLDADVQATDQRIAGSGIDTRVTQEIPDSPFSTVRDSRGELGEMAQQTPAELAAQQQTAIDSAQAGMAALQAQATQALLTARAGTVSDVAGGQGETVTSEVQTRESVSAHAQTIFDTAQRQVTALLDPLSRTAMARWTAGLTRISQDFHDSLDRVQRWIDDRHSGVGGFFVGLGDAVFGLPDWVIEEYDRAERQFGDDVCDLLLGISTDVNGVVAAAQAIIATTRDDIDATFTAMEAQFPEWAAQERARFSGMLDGLSQRVTEAQTSFVRDVSQAATTAVAEAQAAVEERREAARGVIGRIAAAIEAFIDDPVTAIINGLLSLVGIPPAAFWALVARIQQVISDIADDPENFINNLTAGVKQGFQQFFDNFGTHVLHGFWAWLFSGLEVPIPMPTDFSAGSLFSFALQLMGITWPRVREILVRHVGEQNVAIIEAAWQLISVLIQQGPQGLVNMIKEQLTPEMIVQTILEAAVEYLVETLIQQVIMRVIGMLNPVGAIAQAIDLIYQVCSWIFRNAARIFRFVEAIVNGMADVIAGNIGGLANKVEQSLALLVPPVIDFLAGLLHLGGLPNQVAEVITALQARVYQVMDLVIGTLAERGRALLRAAGLGGEDDEEGGHNNDAELGTTVRFSAAGESHRVWVQTAGEDATLMVASIPQPIENKIGEWRGKVSDLPQEQQGSTTGKLNALETVADSANQQAHTLAAAFLQAAADASDNVEPPSDNELENRERAIAGMLDELYTIFGQEPEPEVFFAEQLQGVHAQARADIVAALGQVPKPFPRSWAGASAAAKATAAGQPLELTPLNQAPHAFGQSFGHSWAATATLRAIQQAASSLSPSLDEDRRRAINKALTRIDAEGGRSPAGADTYLGRYKAQLHQEATPFDSGPSSLSKIRATIWQRTQQASAASRIREQMVARIEMATEGPPGPDLPAVVRARIWQLLDTATLNAPYGGVEVHIEISATSIQAVRTYLDPEAAKSGGDPALQRVLEWWSGHIDQAEFHHAWPQWLGGAFNQTPIYIPRALHNFEGITAVGQTFPGGFHQVFNDLFRAAFAAQITNGTLAINDPDKWTVYAAGNGSATATVAGLLVQAYKTVFAPYGASGQAAVQRFVAEARQTYPATPGP